MPILIRQAKSSEDLDEILRLRFECLQKEGARFSEEVLITKKSVDHLDIFPDTLNFYGLVKGEVRAALRSTRYRPNEPMMNLLFDYREAHAGLGKSCAAIDYLALAPDVIDAATVTEGLVKAALLRLALEGFDAAFMSIPLGFFDVLKALGFEPVSEPFLSEWVRDTLVPCRCSLDQYEKNCFASVVDREILKFKELFTLTLFEPGELLAVQGEKGQTAYLIEKGEVDVVLAKDQGLLKLAELVKGQLIGELAMITREARTASLIAKSMTTCYTIERTDFLRLLTQEPYRSLDLFKICSKRLEGVNRRLAQVQEKS